MVNVVILNGICVIWFCRWEASRCRKSGIFGTTLRNSSRKSGEFYHWLQSSLQKQKPLWEHHCLSFLIVILARWMTATHVMTYITSLELVWQVKNRISGTVHSISHLFRISVFNSQMGPILFFLTHLSHQFMAIHFRIPVMWRALMTLRGWTKWV